MDQFDNFLSQQTVYRDSVLINISNAPSHQTLYSRAYTQQGSRYTQDTHNLVHQIIQLNLPREVVHVLVVEISLVCPPARQQPGEDCVEDEDKLVEPNLVILSFNNRQLGILDQSENKDIYSTLLILLKRVIHFS